MVIMFVDQLHNTQILDLDDILGHGLIRVEFTGSEAIGIDPDGDEVPLAEWNVPARAWELDRDLNGDRLIEGSLWPTIRVG